jgi:hypothetical protein
MPAAAAAAFWQTLAVTLLQVQPHTGVWIQSTAVAHCLLTLHGFPSATAVAAV